MRQNAGVIQTVFAIGAGLMAAGAIVTVIGAGIFGLGVVAGGLVTIITTVGTVIGALLSPVGLVVAAIAGAVFIWARFTESGRSSIAGITKFLGDLLGTARETFGGIGDALMAGDLQLAGQIAVTGLQLIFAQGVAAIAKLMGGPLGDVFGTIANKLIKGDLAGAWDTVTKGMAAAWDVVALGITTVFRQVIDVSLGGLAVLARHYGGSAGEQAANAIGMAQASLGAVGATGGNTLGGLSSAAKMIEAHQKQKAGKSALDFFLENAGGAEESSEEVKRLTTQLEQLRNAAREAREAAAAGSSKAPGAEAPEVSGLKQSATATTSAVALGLMGGSSDRLVRAAESAASLQRQQLIKMDTQIEALRKLKFGVT
jgi:hypothetical protein